MDASMVGGRRRRPPAPLHFFLLLSLVLRPAAAQFGSVDDAVVPLDRPLDYRSIPRHGDGGDGGAPIRDPSAAFLEVRLAELCLPDDESLVFVDSDGVERDRVSGCPRPRMGPAWSARITGGEVRLFLRRDGPHLLGPRRFDSPWHEPKLLVDAYLRVAPPNPFTARTVCGPIESRDAACYAVTHREEYSRSRVVGRIRSRRRNGGGWCTGFLISKQNHFLTNEHCVDDAYAALNSEYEWGSESPGCDDGTNERWAYPGEMKFRGATLLKVDPAKDYALLQLDPSAVAEVGDPAREYGYLDFSPHNPPDGEALYVPHHPDGRAREISLRSTHPEDESGMCEVYETNCCSVKYFCDTDGGSSGAPVLGRSNHLVETIHSSGNTGCSSGNYGRIMGQIYEDIKGWVDECGNDEECEALNNGADECSVHRCSGTPRRCVAAEPRDGCCGNGRCEDGETCDGCPADCCPTHTLDTLDAAGGDVMNATRVGHGVMFDVESGGGAPGSDPASIDILQLWFRPHYGGWTEISVYAKEGTWVGSENRPADWTYLGSSSVLLRARVPAAIPSSIVGRNRPLTVPKGEKVAIYVSAGAGRAELGPVPDGVGYGVALRLHEHIKLFAGAAVTDGREVGSLRLSPDPVAFAGRVVYRVRSEEPAKAAAEVKVRNCTRDSDCQQATAADAAGGEPSPAQCGAVWCDIPSGRCVFNAWVDDGPCGDAYFQNCDRDNAKCTKGPRGTDWEGTCTGWNDNECVYRWYPQGGTSVPSNTGTPPGPAPATAPEPTLSAPCCSSIDDCIVDRDRPDLSLSVCDSGLKCDSDLGMCVFHAWNETGPCGDAYFKMCGGDDGLCDKGPKGAAASGAGGAGGGGTCTGWNNNECVYTFCPAPGGGDGRSLLRRQGRGVPPAIAASRAGMWR